MNFFSGLVPALFTSPWAFLLPLLFFFYLNYKTLNSHTEKPESFNKAIAWLREDNFGHFYRLLLGRLLDKVSDWIGDKAQHKARIKLDHETDYQLKPFNRFFSVNPFTSKSYEVLLTFAFIYPILFFLISWVMSSDTSMAGQTWLKQAAIQLSLAQRGLTLFLIVILPVSLIFYLKKLSKTIQWLSLLFISTLFLLLGFYKFTLVFWLVFNFIFLPCYASGWVLAWLFKRNRKEADQIIYSFAFAFAFAFASAVAFVGVFAGAVAVAGVAGVAAGAGAVAGVAAGAVAVTGVVAGGVLGAVAVAVAVVFGAISAGIVTGGTVAFAVGIIFVGLSLFQSYINKKQSVFLFWFLYNILLLSGSFYLIKESSFDGRIFLLFYLVFPLCNAPLDWLSLNITRGLLNSIRHQHHNGWQALGYALFDLLLALLFLLMVSGVLVIAMGFSDWLSGTLYLQTILSEISQPQHAKNYYWVYPMLLTTLLPTLVHFALAGSALTLWLPHPWLLKIVDNLEQSHYKLWAASIYLTITPVIGLIAPIALLCALYLLLQAQGGWLETMLLHWAQWLAALFL